MGLPESNGVIHRYLLWLVPEFGGHIHYSVPQGNGQPGFKPTVPMLVHYRVGGVISDHEHDYPNMVLEVWGQNFNEACNMAVLLAERLIAGEVHSVTGGIVKGCAPHVGPRPFATQPSKAYRMEIQAQFVISSE